MIMGHERHGTTAVVVTHFWHLDILSGRASVQLSFLLFYVSNVLGCVDPDFVLFVTNAGWCCEPVVPKIYCFVVFHVDNRGSQVFGDIASGI